MSDSYLQKRGQTWYARVRVPPKLVDAVGRREVIRSRCEGDLIQVSTKLWELQVELSEIFHALYQAMGRGSCRSTNQGRAAAMTLDWVGTEEFPDSYWQEAAPNIQRQQWASSHITPRKKALDNGMAIKGYLEGLPDSIEYVRSVTVKTGAGLEGISLKAFQRARESASKELLGWSYEGSQRGYIRNPFA